MALPNSPLPSTSLLFNDGKSYDYIDSYRGEFMDRNQTIGATEIGKAFFSSGPKWMEKLFTLRNKIVRVFGLKTPDKIADRTSQLKNFRCEQGDQFGLFKIFNKTNNEIILGEDDKHLNFRVSLFLDHEPNNTHKKSLTISTTVIFNNGFGRLYFLPVRPFHKLIVPAMLKGIIKELERQQA